MCVYDRINKIRKSKGVTWKYLNEKIPGKVYSSRMTELKNGKTALSDEQLIVVAEVLETSTDYLLGNTDDPSPAGQKEISPKIGELTEDELRLLMAYRAASEKKRASLLGLLED